MSTDLGARTGEGVPTRTMAVWVPDWPLVAAGVDLADPAAVFHANRVVAATPVARAAGVRRHMRRREAQGRCPELAIVDADPDRDARRFETVVGALEEFTPRLEVVRSGLVLFPTLGPSRYFGGDEALAVAIVDAVLAAATCSPEHVAMTRTMVGVADGSFAAIQATRTAHRRTAGGDPPIWVVAPGASAEYLAPLSLTALDEPELVDVLRRLGLHTLGDLARLPAADVLGRFGPVGATAHRLARGLDPRPPATLAPPPDLVVAVELDPPADLVAPIAFAARGLADELHRRLESRGSACTRLVVTARTINGEVSERVWRADGVFSAGAIGDRVRWQMDGWLQSPRHRRPTAGICQLEVRPDEVVAAGGRQLGFWGADPASADRAARAIARVQGLLGADSVFVPEVAGGRDPEDQIRLVPAGAVDLQQRSGSSDEAATASLRWPTVPWPGRLPHPWPATVHAVPVPVDVLDDCGRSVRIDGRLSPTASPEQLVVAGRRRRITSWAGPWPVDERWWDADRHSRRVRFQVVTEDGVAHLVVLESGHWSVTATYD